MAKLTQSLFSKFFSRLCFISALLYSLVDCSRPEEFLIANVACAVDPNNPNCVGIVDMMGDGGTNNTNSNNNTSPYIGSLTPMPNSSYGSKGSVFFPDERTIVFTNFSLGNPPDGLVYLGYGGNGGNYVANGQIISEVIRNLNNTTLTLTLSQDLKDTDFTHVAIICRQFRFVINPGVQFRAAP